MSADPVMAAVMAGKIIPARAKHYRRLMEYDPEGTTELLAGLAAVLPVDEVGVAVLPRDKGRSQASSEDCSYPREWLGPAENRNGPIITGND